MLKDTVNAVLIIIYKNLVANFSRRNGILGALTYLVNETTPTQFIISEIPVSLYIFQFQRKSFFDFSLLNPDITLKT